MAERGPAPKLQDDDAQGKRRGRHHLDPIRRPEKKRNESERHEDAYAPQGMDNGFARRGRTGSHPQEPEGEIDPEEGRQPDDADKSAEAAGFSAKESGRPASQLSNQPERRDRESDEC